jgi:hypothetical protein
MTDLTVLQYNVNLIARSECHVNIISQTYLSLNGLLSGQILYTTQVVFPHNRCNLLR